MTHTTSHQVGTQTDTDGTVLGITEASTVLGTTAVTITLGTMVAHIIPDGTTLGITAVHTMVDGTTLGTTAAHTTDGTTLGITDTCIHAIADGTEHGSHISITITMSDTRQEASIRAEKCTEDPARQQPAAAASLQDRHLLHRKEAPSDRFQQQAETHSAQAGALPAGRHQAEALHPQADRLQPHLHREDHLPHTEDRQVQLHALPEGLQHMTASRHRAAIHITVEVHPVLQAHRRAEAIHLQAVQAIVPVHQAEDTAEAAQAVEADTAEAVPADADNRQFKLIKSIT